MPSLRTGTAVHKFLLFKIHEQNTFWSFITDAPQFRYGGNFTFSGEMQQAAAAVKVAIKDFEAALAARGAEERS